ncbi:general stress protein [Chryseomicrobium palamuruense]|uniref:General stress protein n=1 Tax=Chryseomicrobium palamuruense TaxID=682973 RepID=A0ABV8UXP2_9BACL
MENRYYRTFDNEQDLQTEMDRLRAEGYTDEDMYIMSKRDDRMGIYRGHNGEHEGHEKESLWEKFKEFVTGDETDEQFNRMSFEEDERRQYYDDVTNGKHLLYADREFGHRPY